MDRQKDRQSGTGRQMDKQIERCQMDGPNDTNTKTHFLSILSCNKVRQYVKKNQNFTIKKKTKNKETNKKANKQTSERT